MLESWLKRLNKEVDGDGNAAYPDMEDQDWDCCPRGEAVWVSMELTATKDSENHDLKEGDKATFAVPCETSREGNETVASPYNTTLWEELGVEPVRKVKEEDILGKWRAYLEPAHYTGPASNTKMATHLGDTLNQVTSSCVESLYDDNVNFRNALKLSKNKFQEFVAKEYPRKFFFMGMMKTLMKLTPNEWYKIKRDNLLEDIETEWKTELFPNALNNIVSASECKDATKIKAFQTSMGQPTSNTKFLHLLMTLAADKCGMKADDPEGAQANAGAQAGAADPARGRYYHHPSSSAVHRSVADLKGTVDKQGAILSSMKNTLEIVARQLNMRAVEPSDVWKAAHIRVNEGNAYFVMQAFADKLTDPDAGISVGKEQAGRT